MRHRVGGFKLGRDTEHRKAMWRNMAISLLTHGQITTTVPKAKSLKPFVEKLITLAKKGDLASRRRVISQIGNPIMVKFDEDPDVSRNKYGELVDGPKLVKRLFDVIGPQFADRNGGYTRIVRLGKHRIGDAGDLCVIQLVGEESGPQVSGQYSRRRDKCNKRMEFAAKLRKGAKAEAAPKQEAPEAPAAEEKTEE
ncbi:MAG: 50S ribosomal protein L17 [Phycisphaeraceae bacterium JB051]